MQVVGQAWELHLVRLILLLDYYWRRKVWRWYLGTVVGGLVFAVDGGMVVDGGCVVQLLVRRTSGDDSAMTSEERLVICIHIHVVLR